VARAFFASCLYACVLSAQQPAAQPPAPPEEDEALQPKVYALNPVQAKKEIVAGDYYLKKPNYSAAVKRYLEATRWDPGSAEAFLKLGAAHEKLREYGPAREAYSKFLELGEDPKEKDLVRKKMAKWPDATKTSGKK
jgi:tetratricopeptide (TPR) repeat protein